MYTKIIEIIAVGLVAGIIGGSLGLSSAPILVPLMVILDITKDYKTAIGTAILVIIPPLSIFAIQEYFKRGEVNINTALLLMAACVLGSYLGSLITTETNISDKTIALLTSFILACLSLFWLIMANTGFNINAIQQVHNYLPTFLF